MKLLLALMTRNQISTWAMWKSDFRMAHVEIWFLFSSASNNFTNFLNKNLKIAWLTHSGIQFLNGPWFSGMKIGPFRNPIFLKQQAKLSFWSKDWFSKKADLNQPCWNRFRVKNTISSPIFSILNQSNPFWSNFI